MTLSTEDTIANARAKGRTQETHDQATWWSIQQLAAASCHHIDDCNGEGVAHN